MAVLGFESVCLRQQRLQLVLSVFKVLFFFADIADILKEFFQDIRAVARLFDKAFVFQNILAGMLQFLKQSTTAIDLFFQLFRFAARI